MIDVQDIFKELDLQNFIKFFQVIHICGGAKSGRVVNYVHSNSSYYLHTQFIFRDGMQSQPFSIKWIWWITMQLI